jgi:hypothetical protein
MAGLTSAGVQVQVIDESFYTTAIPGTVPLIFVATKANKNNPAGTAVAPGTLVSNVGKVWTITSQRDLVDTFGTPLFYTDTNSNPVHAGELNEYGLQAAYSLLGISSKAFVVRADVDLSQLVQTSSEPKGDPTAGTYWIDTTSSKFGIEEWLLSTKTFINKTPLVIDDDNLVHDADLTGVPKSSFGNIGDYAVVITSMNEDAFYFKNKDNIWVKIGSNVETNFGATIVGATFTSNAWQSSWPLVTGTVGAPNPGNKFTINGVEVTLTDVTVDGIATLINTQLPQLGIGAKSDGSKLYLYADATAQSDLGQPPDGKIALADRTGGTLASLGLTAGSYGPVSLTIAPHTKYPQYGTSKAATGSIYIKTTAPNQGASWAIKYYNATTKAWQPITAPIYGSTQQATASLDSSGGTNIPAGTFFVESNYNGGTGGNTTPVEAEFKIHRRSNSSPTTIAVTISPTFTFTTGATFQVAETVAGSSSLASPRTVTITTSSIAGFAAAVSAAGLTNVTASYDPTSNVLKMSHKLGGDFYMIDGGSLPLYNAGFYNTLLGTYATNLYPTGTYLSPYTLKASNWKPIDLLTSTVVASKHTPSSAPADGQLWYSAIQDEVDIMYHNGVTWVGYHTAFPACSPDGPIIRATAPSKDDGQSDGTPLVDGDIWIDSSDPEMYGLDIYVWNQSLIKWIKQDVADQTSPTGWLFADARWSGAGDDIVPDSIQKLLSYDYLDPDAPDPTLYPQGMRLWNTRRSGNNVKKYMANAIDITANLGKNLRFNDEIMDGSTAGAKYATARWVNAAGNNENGSGKFGRHAQRGFVVKAFKSLIDTNQNIRDTDTMVLNLIACPGYPEAIQNMVGLNASRGITAFVIGDTPFRLPANGTDLRAWGSSTTALDNGDDGAVTHDEYLGMYYPSGYTNDNAGNYIVVPPSHMILRMMAISDQKSYPWFAPAGTRRGGIDNATAVGYIKDGEFQQSPIPENLRNVLQDVSINPIATLPGAGLVVFGQKTRARNASSLDRVNVARLVAYLRRQLDLLARPFLFEPNDRITRNEMKQTAESLLLELTSQRALYDYIVVCDESNNTPARIDRNELYLDIAIEPVKAVEFIYIPLRLKNTGDIAAGR